MQAKKASDKEALAARKEREAKKKAELNELFKPLETIQQPKVPFGVDPKSLVCAFYKAGRCEKGSKCKYSHDLGVERKSAKANIYEDQRDETKDKGESLLPRRHRAPVGTDRVSERADTMDKWDDEKLRQVVETKRNGQTTTDIVCKHFINAVENGTYGWFWTCPDGGDQCKYRHALPPGFVLKSQQKRDEEEANKQTITLEEFLETARHKLDQSKLTPITKESFAKWKQTRMDKREAEESAIRKTKEATAASGRATGMSGRDLFSFNPTFMGEDSDDDGDDDDWDLQAFREQTERDRAKAEEDRCVISPLVSYGPNSLTTRLAQIASTWIRRWEYVDRGHPARLITHRRLTCATLSWRRLVRIHTPHVFVHVNTLPQRRYTYAAAAPLR